MHLIIAGHSSGPLTPDEVRGMWREGKISSSTLFWREGQAEWLPLGTIAAELFPEGLPPGSHLISSRSDGVVYAMPSPERPLVSIIAGFWIRPLALFIDTIILGLIGSVLGTIFFDQLAQVGNWGRLIGFVSFLAYFGLLESTLAGGQTVGKRICRIRVVSCDGQCISLGRSLLRTSVWAVPYSLNNLHIPAKTTNTWFVAVLGLYLYTFIFALFYLYVFNRRTRQSVHDLVTGTYVVAAKTQGSVDLLPISKWHYAVIGVWFIFLLGLGVLIEVSGFGKSFLSSLAALQEKVYAIPDVRSVDVTQGKTFTSDGTTSELSIIVTFNHAIPDSAKAERDVAASFLSDLDWGKTDLEKPDRIKISVGRSYNIGIASGNYYDTDSRSPDDWTAAIKPDH